MNTFNYSQIFKTAEKTKEESDRDSKLRKVTEMLDEDFEMSQMKSRSISTSQITDRQSLTKTFNKLLFKNQKKAKEIEELKEIIENFKKANNPIEFQRKKSEFSLVEMQSSINSRYIVTETEKSEYIEKLKNEIEKINEKHDQEYFMTEQLVSMKAKAKQSIINMKKKVWEIQINCESARKYETRASIMERVADNDKIRTSFNNTLQRLTIKTERRNRQDKLSFLAQKETVLKKDIEELALKFAEDTVKNDDQKEFRTVLSQDLKEVLLDHDELRAMSQKIQSKLEVYEDVFRHVKELTKKSKCLDGGLENPGILPQDVVNCFGRMISIETKLKERFEDLTSIHNKLKYKCDRITNTLSKLKKSEENSVNVDDIKKRVKGIRPRNASEGVTLTDLIVSWDTLTDDTGKHELIEKYEKVSAFTGKFLSETCSKVLSTLQNLFMHTNDIKSQEILHGNSTFLTEFQEPPSAAPKSPIKSLDFFINENSILRQKIEISLKSLLRFLSGHAELTTEIGESIKSYDIPEQKEAKIIEVLSFPVSKHNSKAISGLITSAIKMKIQELITKKVSKPSGLKEVFDDFVKRFKICEINMNTLNTEDLVDETDPQSPLNSGHNANESAGSPRSRKKKKISLPKLYQMPSNKDRRSVIQEIKLIESKIDEVKKQHNKERTSRRKENKREGFMSRLSSDKSLPSLSQSGSEALFRTYSHMSTGRR
ncbi:unnamed protein product [Blepharisma stoltei]|uniref:Uncharacterized protein n=1 Tax=Blepharisma stoltei TaxID=1481888 RepID=A0AAU9K9L9_9CILI|nr:unnamed protein product [Blepharisma stoltei]